MIASSYVEDGRAMRRFIRHPSNVPISVDVTDQHSNMLRPNMVNVGVGGLCFSSSEPFSKGSTVQISIPVQLSPFEVVGLVAWCQKHDGKYLVGVSFPNDAAAYSVRMVEQVCHIEQYRMDQLMEGRALTSEEAAREWIDKFAADFPRH